MVTRSRMAGGGKGFPGSLAGNPPKVFHCPIKGEKKERRGLFLGSKLLILRSVSSPEQDNAAWGSNKAGRGKPR